MDILESNNIRHCRNCREPLASDALYCPKCSQKYTDGKVPIWQLLHELFESFFNFDSKIFRTLGALFIPGKLTIEYFKGRHVSYIPPVRIFLILAVLHFAILGFSGFDAIDFNISTGQKDLEKSVRQATFLGQLDSAQQKVLAEDFPDNPTARRAFDSLRHQFQNVQLDTLEFGYFDLHSDFSIEPVELNLAQADLYEPFEVIAEKYRIQGFWEKIQVRQMIRLLTETSSFSGFLLGKLIWMVILMMPALALVLKLLYIRRRRYFVEHLVFSFHYHAFAFLVIGIAVLLTNLPWFKGAPDDEDQAAPVLIGFLIIIVYLFIAMRRVYGQGFWKTFFKFNILNFSYIFIFTLFFVLTLVISVLIF